MQEGFEFTPVQERHLAMLREWLARPHVAQWWQPTPSIAELRRDYVLDPGTTRAYIASHAGEPIGFIQCYTVLGSGDGWWEDEKDPGARGLDQFLCGEARLGQGLGSAMVRAFVDLLFADPAVTVVQVDPAPGNLRAIRCYGKAGFAGHGIVETPDGPALLMRRARSHAADPSRPSSA